MSVIYIGQVCRLRTNAGSIKENLNFYKKNVNAYLNLHDFVPF